MLPVVRAEPGREAHAGQAIEINWSTAAEAQKVCKPVKLECSSAPGMYPPAQRLLQGVDAPWPFHLIPSTNVSAVSDRIDPASQAILRSEFARDALALKPGVHRHRGFGPGLQQFVYLHARKTIHI